MAYGFTCFFLDWPGKSCVSPNWTVSSSPPSDEGRLTGGAKGASGWAGPPKRPTTPNHHSPLSDSSEWETCSVQLNVRLPRDVAAQAEAVQETDPEFLSRVILYGFTRRSVYNQLRHGTGEGGRERSADQTVGL